jgi:hypothetical protein
MTGSTIPGMTADVVHADIASRHREAQAHRPAAELAQELRAARREARRARRATRTRAPRRRTSWLLGQLTHDPAA